jgi:branched-chain amino acid aminotransferase
LLQGITRNVILQIAQKLAITCEETSLTAHDMIQADECFLTGTGAELIPVSQINHHKLQQPAKALFPLIAQTFKQTVIEHCKSS